MAAREIVSWYGFSSYGSNSEAIHELRQIVSVDGKPVSGAPSADDFRRLLLARDDDSKHKLVEDFQNATIGDAPFDFGQLVMLFTRRSIDRYTFTLKGPDLIGAQRVSVFQYSQQAGSPGLHLDQNKPIPLAGTLSLRGIVNAQSGFIHIAGINTYLPHWYIFYQPLGFFVYFTSAIAETNRVPFDLPEGETELVGGFHTEYSSMKFAMFFMSEYANMITVSCLATLLFFGGWHGPGQQWVWLPTIVRIFLPVFWFALKVFCFMFFYIWMRGTLPRFRYDQLMSLGWKFLLPLGLLNILVTSFLIAWHG